MNELKFTNLRYSGDVFHPHHRKLKLSAFASHRMNNASRFQAVSDFSTYHLFKVDGPLLRPLPNTPAQQDPLIHQAPETSSMPLSNTIMRVGFVRSTTTR